MTKTEAINTALRDHQRAAARMTATVTVMPVLTVIVADRGAGGPMLWKDNMVNRCCPRLPLMNPPVIEMRKRISRKTEGIAPMVTPALPPSARPSKPRRSAGTLPQMATAPFTPGSGDAAKTIGDDACAPRWVLPSR